MFIQVIRRYAPKRPSQVTISKLKSPTKVKTKQQKLDEEITASVMKRMPKFKDPDPIISPIINTSNKKSK
jgi:hypothetical protein